MWRRRVRTKKQLRDQSEAEGGLGVTEGLADEAGNIETAKINSTPIKRLRVTGNVAVATEDGSPIVGISNDHYIGLVISRTGNHPRLHLARVIGGAQIRVADTAADLETAEFVSQEDVDHTCHRIAAIESRGAILQDIDVINHWERNEIDVHPGGAGSRNSRSPASDDRSALSIDEDQSFLGQQTPQIGYETTITTVGDVLVDGRAHLLWQLREQVGCV